MLFSAPMVRALLAGTKTQTRRVVTHPLLKHLSYIVNCGEGWWGDEEGDAQARCPYGQPGDQLWVRETWRVGAWLHRDPGGRLADAIAVDYRADNHARREWLGCHDRDQFARLVQQSIADAEQAGIKPYRPDTYNWDYGKGPTRWRPSIHMPCLASRITLELTGVRVEQLQDISEADAIAEGIEPVGRGWRHYGSANAGELMRFPKNSYRSLWESINGSDSWAANPWVWVIDFKVVKP